MDHGAEAFRCRLVLAPYAMFSGESHFASSAVWRKFTWLALIDPGKLRNLSMSSKVFWGKLTILAGCLCYAVHGVTAKRLGFENPIKQSACVCLVADVMGLAK
jgi:hypothetical protein